MLDINPQWDTLGGLGGGLHSGSDVPALQPPQTQPTSNQNNPDYIRAVIDMVNGTLGTVHVQINGVLTTCQGFTGSTMATILENNEFPALSGFSIPANLSQTIVVAQAVQPGTAPPTGVMFVNNPTSNEGGSWVTANKKTREIISLDTGVSTSAPVDYSQLFQYIKHSGAFNTETFVGFQNPPPIERTHAQQMPPAVFNGGPVIDHATVPQPVGTDGSVYDLLVTMVLATTQADGVTWSAGVEPPWFQGVKFYRRLTGSSNISQIVEVADMGYEASMTYEQAIEVGANNTYDIGFAFIDLANNISKINWPSGSSDLVMPAIGGNTIGGLADVNLISNTNFDHPSPNWSNPGAGPHNLTTAAHQTYWSDNGLDNESAFFAKSGSTTTATGAYFAVVGNGDADRQNNFRRYICSEPINVESGFSYTLSGYIDATQVGNNAGCKPSLALYDYTGRTFEDGGGIGDLSTALLVVAQDQGSLGRISGTWACTDSTIKQVVVVLDANKAGGATPNTGFLVMATPMLEYGSQMTVYKGTAGKTSYGVPDQSGNSKPIGDVDVTMTNVSVTDYDITHFTYGCQVDFDITISPNAGRWLDRAMFVYCDPGTFDGTTITGYPVCSVVPVGSFPLKSESKHVSAKVHGLPCGDAWDLMLVLYDGSGTAHFSNGSGTPFKIVTTTRHGKVHKPVTNPNPTVGSVSITEYESNGSVYGGTLSFQLSLGGGDPPLDQWCTGAKLFYTPQGAPFDNTGKTGYPSCAELPYDAITTTGPMVFPFGGLSCGEAFDLHLVLLDIDGDHFITLNNSNTPDTTIITTEEQPIDAGSMPAMPLLASPGVPTLSQVSGTVAAHTWYVMTTYTNGNGETLASEEATFTTTTGNLKVTSPAASGSAIGYYVYVTNEAHGGSGTEMQQNGGAFIAIGTDWTMPNTGLDTSGSLVPTKNTCANVTIGARSITLSKYDAGDPGTEDTLMHPGIQAVWTLTDGNAKPAAKWMWRTILYLRRYTTAKSQTDATTYVPHPQEPRTGGYVDGLKITNWVSPVTPNKTYDVAVAGADAHDNHTNLAYLGTIVIGKMHKADTIGPVFGRGHFLGDTSGDISTAILDGYNNFKHEIMSTAVQGRILNDLTLLVDGVTGPVSGHLPQNNHDLTVIDGAVGNNKALKNHVPDSDVKFSNTYWTLNGGISVAVAGD